MTPALAAWLPAGLQQAGGRDAALDAPHETCRHERGGATFGQDAGSGHFEGVQAMDPRDTSLCDDLTGLQGELP